MTGSPLASTDNARRTLETMWTIRRFEEAVDDLYSRLDNEPAEDLLDALNRGD